MSRNVRTQVTTISEDKKDTEKDEEDEAVEGGVFSSSVNVSSCNYLNDRMTVSLLIFVDVQSRICTVQCRLGQIAL